MKNQFEKHIQQAMNHHELPVSDSVWASIQQKQSKKPLIYYIGRISAACLLLFLGQFTYTHVIKTRLVLDTIVVEQKLIKHLELDHTVELKKVFASIPEIAKPEIQKQELPIIPVLNRPNKEVIVLNVKTKHSKRKKLYNRIPQVSPLQKTHVDSEMLLVQIENKLSIKNKKAFESYLTDIKKLASKNSINNKIQTAQAWIAKTATDIGIANKKTQKQ